MSNIQHNFGWNLFNFRFHKQLYSFCDCYVHRKRAFSISKGRDIVNREHDNANKQIEHAKYQPTLIQQKCCRKWKKNNEIYIHTMVGMLIGSWNKWLNASVNAFLVSTEENVLPNSNSFEMGLECLIHCTFVEVRLQIICNVSHTSSILVLFISFLAIIHRNKVCSLLLSARSISGVCFHFTENEEKTAEKMSLLD